MWKTLREELDTTPLDFGKYKGKTPEQIANINPGYIVWLFEKTQRQVFSPDLYEECKLACDTNSFNKTRSYMDYPMDESPYGELDYNDNWR